MPHRHLIAIDQARGVRHLRRATPRDDLMAMKIEVHPILPDARPSAQPEFAVSGGPRQVSDREREVKSRVR